jgi:anti-anti-sigma regulatory factor
MKIGITQTGGISTVALAGELQVAFVGEAKEALMAVLRDSTAIVFDLRDVTRCDTAGVQFLLMVRASARARNIGFSMPLSSVVFQAAIDSAGIPLNCFNPKTAIAA